MAIFEHEYMVNMEKIGSKSNLITNKGLLNIFQDIGCLHSDVAGLGINDIPNTHLSWVVLHWKVKVLKRAKYGEILKVKTWSRSATKVHCYRDFAVYNQNDELICMATSKWTLTNREKKSLEVQGVKFFKQFVILKFKGLDNINDIEKYRQKSLYVTRKNAVRLQRDEYFIADLIGLKVQDEDGTELGTVKDVIETGANDVYEVEMADGRSLLLPAIKQCILNVDVENGMMQVHVLEGLLDL